MPTLKGAFLKFDGGPLSRPSVIVFQINPVTVSRTPSLAQTDVTPENAKPENPRQIVAAPTEAFSFNLRLDATDQLAARNPIAITNGILPALSALELLMYPVPATGAMLKIPGGGAAHANAPNLLPIVLFFWGPQRVMPVNVKSLTINELEYDSKLNPIRAEVTVNLQVVTPPALDQGSKIMQGAYQYTQSVKEVMAALSVANSASLAGSMLAPIRSRP